jgi:eukaryotic-like serine/threonine-protein kinase
MDTLTNPHEPLGPMSNPKTLGRYEILEEIGAGMMGSVYRGRDPLLDRVVALKTVRMTSSMESQERRSFEQRFLVEARAAAALSHPGVVTVHDCGKDPVTGTLFTAFEYLEGYTLADLLSAGGPFEWRRALRLTARLAKTLDHAHRKGVVHRDIKPANIMVLPSGEPKIMDFGIAKLPTSALTLPGDFLGTPSYMSPEQAAGETVDGRSDLFSLGAVLYTLLTGRRAFEGQSLPATVTQVLHAKQEPPSQLVPGLPPAIDALVGRALAKNPNDRFQTGNALARSIEALLDPTAALFGQSVLPSVPRRGGSRFGLLMAAALVTTTLVTLGDPTLPNALVPSEAKDDVVVAAMSAPTPAPTPAATPQPRAPDPATGRLEISFEHSLGSGRLKVLVDNKAVFTGTLDKSKGAKKLLIQRTSQGRPLSVSPGVHAIRVQVEDGKNAWSAGIEGNFRSDATLRLKAKLGGFLRKKLSLELQT